MMILPDSNNISVSHSGFPKNVYYGKSSKKKNIKDTISSKRNEKASSHQFENTAYIICSDFYTRIINKDFVSFQNIMQRYES